MKLDILEKVGSKLSPIAVKLSAKSPELLLAGGVVAVLGGTVLACRATLKMPEHVYAKDAEITENVLECTDEEVPRVKTMAYLHLGVETLKEYAPSALLIGGGIAMIVGGHYQLRARLGALGAAYATLETAYSKYRERVIADYGEDVDKRYRLGIFQEEVTEVKTLKNGKEKATTKIVESVHADGSPYSLYARYFDAYSSNMHTADQEENMDFLLISQSLCNEKYDRQGYLFLNDVYKQLGFDPVPEGQLVGWMKGLGDDYIDFGIFEARNADARDFANFNGKETCFVLDFNVDGVMWNLIGGNGYPVEQ